MNGTLNGIHWEEGRASNVGWWPDAPAFKDRTLAPVNADSIHACSGTNDVLLRQWLQRQKAASLR